MIIDTSAIIALSFEEPTAEWVAAQIAGASRVLMSTVNLAETLIIFRDRQPQAAARLESDLLTSGIEFIPPDAAIAAIVAKARTTYPLNLGDCFAYALAKTTNLPLLTLDADFRSTGLQLLFPPGA